MNNDIKFKVAKYLNEPLAHEEECKLEINSVFYSKDFLRHKITFTSKILNKKLRERPSIEYLKNINILKNDLMLKEIKDRLSNLLLLRADSTYNRSHIAPSISSLVKKMDFEYKKIVIIHKLNIKKF